MSDSYSLQQIASALKISKQAVHARAKREGWTYTESTGRGGKRRLYPLEGLPAEVQATLITGQDPVVARAPVSEGYDRDALWAHFDAKSEKQKQLARDRLAAINTALGLNANGVSMTDAFKTAARQAGMDRSTLYRWYGRVKGYDRSDWLAGLVSGYSGQARTAEIPAEAWDIFRSDYLRLEQPAAAACYSRLERIAAERGWQLPSLRTFERRIEREIPKTVRVLMRQGESALAQLYPAQRRSVFNLHALEWVNGDGYQHNVFVQWPDGTIARPKTWFWQDVYSRKVLSHRTDQTEHTDMLRLAFGDMVDSYGIPDHVTIDNTRAAANKWMTGGVPNRYRFKVKEDDPLGIMPILGIEVHWTSVIAGKGHGQAKPVERAFGVGGLGEYIDKHPRFAGAYTGANPHAKPENYQSAAVPLDTFLEVLAEEIAAWNAKRGRRTEICAGEFSFDEVFNRSYAQSTIRKATAEQRRLWLLAAEAIRVAQDGTVTLDAGAIYGTGKNRYHADALYEFAGKKVVVRFDPQQLHETAHVYTLDGRYIAEAQCITATGFGDTQAAREHNRARRDMMKATKAAAKAEQRMDALEIAGQLPRHAPGEIPEAKVVRTFTPPRHQAAPPQRRELTAAEREAVAAIGNDSNVHSLQETPRQRYQRWLAIDARHQAGEVLTEQERNFHRNYPQSSEFRGQRAVAEDFGLIEAK